MKYTKTSMVDDAKSKDIAEEDILEDVGYYELLKQRDIILQGNPEQAELFSKLQSVANECNTLQQSIRSLGKVLVVAREEAAMSTGIDATEQKESDNKMEIIRCMEDRVATIENISIPQELQRKTDLESDNRRIQSLIDKGSGWTPEQKEERGQLKAKLDQSQRERTEATSNLADLRSKINEKEVEVDTAVKTRDELNCNLDKIETKIINAEGELRSNRNAVEEAKRNQTALEATVEQSNSELKDLIKERDEAKDVAKSIVKERSIISTKSSNVMKELDNLVDNNSNLLDELKAIKKENLEVNAQNEAMKKVLELKRREHQDVLELRAKMAKLRVLIEQKCDDTDQTRKSLEKERNTIHFDTVQLETEIPMQAKENEALKRLAKRHLKEVELLNRKREITCRGCDMAKELINSHQSTLKTQENEILGIKMDIRQHEASQSQTDAEINRDEETLKKILQTCNEKRIMLNKLEECNRELEASIKVIEATAHGQQDRCEDQRQEHNKQTKVLLELRADIHNAKQEYKVLFEQRKRVKEDICGTENNVFGQHRHLHHINKESEGIEKDIRAYSKQGSELNLKKEGLSIAIDKICRDIDDMDKRKEDFRKQYRRNTSEKDIIVSCCSLGISLQLVSLGT